MPNPFESFGTVGILLNYFAEPIIARLSYIIVGLFYDSGSAPALGSLAYFVVFSSIITILWILSIYEFAWWWVLLILILIFIVIKFLTWLYEKIFWY